MSPEESAALGASTAKLLRTPITASMEIPGISQVHWWGGFLAGLAYFCQSDIGAEAHAILQGVTAEALKSLQPKGPAS